MRFFNETALLIPLQPASTEFLSITANTRRVCVTLLPITAMHVHSRPHLQTV